MVCFLLHSMRLAYIYALGFLLYFTILQAARLLQANIYRLLPYISSALVAIYSFMEFALRKEVIVLPLATFLLVKEMLHDTRSVSYTHLSWLKSEETNKYRKEVVDVMEYVEAHLDQRLTLCMIAQHFEMSESTLSRMFKNETGKNMNYYINEKKMQKAMEILVNDAAIDVYKRQAYRLSYSMGTVCSKCTVIDLVLRNV